MKSIVYTRISAPQSKFNNKFLSLENQRIECIKAIDNNNETVFFEEVVSGRNIYKQKELMKIFNNFSNCKLYIYNISRFTRDLVNGLQYLQVAKKLNITIYFVESELNTGNRKHSRRIIRDLLKAREESNDISDRVKDSIKIRKMLGIPIGRTEYGKKSIQVNGKRKLVDDEFEQKTKKFIKRARHTQSCREMNQLLNNLIPNNKDPIVFIDTDGSIIKRFKKNNHLNFQEIADLLNSYNIKKRGKEWTKNNVTSVYKKS